MRSRMTTASVHQSRTNWQLYLAEYEMLHGSRDEAQRLASDALSRSAHTAHAAPTRWHTEGPRCVLIAEKPGPACGAAPKLGPAENSVGICANGTFCGRALPSAALSSQAHLRRLRLRFCPWGHLRTRSAGPRAWSRRRTRGAFAHPWWRLCNDRRIRCALVRQRA